MIPVLMEKQRYRVDEFEAFLRLPENRDRLFELIEGEIVEKMPTEEHGSIASTISYFLTHYARYMKKGIVGVEVRYGIPQDIQNSRLPDVSYTVKNRSPSRVGAVPAMPDLAVEIRSPDDTVKAMREKAEYYLLNGAQLVWLIYPRPRTVEVYTLDTIEILGIDDILTGGDLLPDFSIAVKEIFAAPYEDT